METLNFYQKLSKLTECLSRMVKDHMESLIKTAAQAAKLVILSPNLPVTSLQVSQWFGIPQQC